jgi:hypothetical protein
MQDSDQGSRTIHCNSNYIGFLNQAGSWAFAVDDTGNTNNWYNSTIAGTLTVTGNQYFNGEFIEGDGKEMFRYSDAWLRINEDNDFSSGIYCGTGVLRTDGAFQVGSSGTKFLVTAAGAVTAESTLTLDNGQIVLGGTGRIQGVDTVSAGTDAANKTYVDTKLSLAGGTMANTNLVTNMNADLLDGISSASFLRSDADDTASQRIRFSANQTNNWDTIATASGSQGGIEVYNTGSGNDAFMAFHAGADYAFYFGIDADNNQLSVGGWSMGANKYKVWNGSNDGAGSGLDADLLDGQQGSYYASAASLGNYLPLAGGVMTGKIKRSSAIVGFLEGSYNNVGDNSANTNPIYTIGSSYNPSSTTLSNMYGIGYTNGNNASFMTLSGATGWGMYVASNGDARVWLDGGNGNISHSGDLYVGGGDITLAGTGRIQGVDTVSASTDAANKAYVDAHGGGLGPFLPIANPTFTGTLTGPTATITTITGSLVGNATSATQSNSVVITGYGNGNFTFYQTSGAFAGYTGWANYFIGNHGNGSNYYNTIHIMPFWGAPKYSRLEGNVQSAVYDYWTSENHTPSNYLPLAAGSSYPLTGDLYIEGADKALRINNGTQPVVYLGDGGANTDGQLLLYNSSGTANIVFNGDNQNHYITNGNVGIGTTTPNARLNVAGGIKIEGTSSLSFGGTASVPAWGINSSGNDLIINDQATTVGDVLFTNARNVGIGVTSADAKLEVAQSAGGAGLNIINASETAFRLSTRVEDTTVNTVVFRQGIYHGNTENATIAFYRGSSSVGGFMTFQTQNGNERMRINANGNVGIGTTDPGALLEVYGSSPNILINNTAETDSGIVFTDAQAGTGQRAAIKFSSSDNKLKFFVDDEVAQRMVIDTVGNVGIGTTNPTSALGSTKVLDISSTGNGEVILDHTDAGTTSDLGLYSWARSNDHLAHIKATCDGSTSAAFISFHAQPSGGSFSNAGSNEKMRIQSNGYVGIGTTSPNLKLDVVSGTNNGIRISATDTTSNWRDISIRSYVSETEADALGEGTHIYTSSPSGTSTETPFSYYGATVIQGRDNGNGGLAIRLGNGGGFATRMWMGATGVTVFSNTVTATNFILSSDERLKENIEKACDNRIKADWKTFELKTDKGQKRYGVIAQELEKTNPEFVREDTQGFKSVAYIDLLIAKIAELEARLEKLEK